MQCIEILYENQKTHVNPGNAVHFVYTLGVEAIHNVWMGINGYFLQQIKNSQINGVEIPHSKERIFSSGFGALYALTPDDNIFVNFYFEALAKNRPQGMSLFLRYFKYF